MTLNEIERSTYELFMPPKPLTVSEWADKCRVLTSETSSVTGPWRTDRAPYQREVMDAFTQPDVFRIVVMASSQVGKSEIELNMIGWAIDTDPGPILHVSPNEKTIEDMSKRRITPMINASPTLRRKVYKAKGRDASNTISIKTFPGGSLTLVGSNSPADLASKPVRYIIMDEIDRFARSAGAEGDPVELAERRTETFRANRKIVMVSTPTIKGKSKIEDAYMSGTQEEWHTECPHCKQYSFIRFHEHVRFDYERYKDKSGKTQFIVTNPRWKCPTCLREIPEADVKRLPAKWVVQNERALENGVRSFRLNVFMSPWSNWRETCLKFLEAKEKNDPELMKTFVNTYLGESWELRETNGVPETLYARRERYEAEVPEGVLLLTMGIDTQDNRLEYEVVGWGRDGESWGISRGIIPGRADTPQPWITLDGLLDREWQHALGVKLKIVRAFIDSGGNQTQAVYDETAKRKHKRLWAIKGRAGENQPYVSLMKDARNLKRGQVAFIIGVDSGKDAIMYSAMEVTQPGPNYAHFPINYEAGYDMEFFNGYISERKVVRRARGQTTVAWEKTYARNEPLDCRNYAQAAYRSHNWDYAKLEQMILGEGDTEPILTRADQQRRQRRLKVSEGVKV